MTSPPETLVQLQNNSTELFLMMLSTKISQMVPLHIIKGAARAVDLKCDVFKQNLLLNLNSKLIVIQIFVRETNLANVAVFFVESFFP